MSGPTENPAAAIAIRPFQVSVPDEDLVELRPRIDATRWPERETVDDDSQGVPLATMQELARYWATDNAKAITIPFAISVFLDELYQAPRSWAERAYPDILIHYNRLDRGGHFAAWEQPQLLSEELRAAFRSLR